MQRKCEETSKQWLDHLFSTWLKKDFEEIAEIFSSCTLYMEDPFYPIVRNVNDIVPLWAEIEGQSNISLHGEVLLCDDSSAAFRWHAKFESEGKHYDLDGVYFARFDLAGQCTEFRQWTSEAE